MLKTILLFTFLLFINTSFADDKRPIGASCSFDNDCASDNCYFSICSGENGGGTPIGGSCSFDSDCASGNCHFRICERDEDFGRRSGESCSLNNQCASNSCNSYNQCD